MVLIHPVRNHLTVGTRARLTAVGNIGFGIKIKPRIKTCTVHPRTSSSSLTNHSFSLWKWRFGLDIPARNHLASETRAVLQTDGTIISSPHFGFSIQIKPEEKLESPYQVWRHPNDQWKSNKLLTLVITPRRENSVFIIWLSLWKWYALVNVRAEARLAYSHFFAGVIHHPTHASSRRELHPLFFWSYFSI